MMAKKWLMDRCHYDGSKGEGRMAERGAALSGRLGIHGGAFLL